MDFECMGGGLKVAEAKDRNRQDDGRVSRRPVLNANSTAFALYFISSILRVITRSGETSRSMYMPLGQCEQSHVTV
jgi:hypothetical protein